MISKVSNRITQKLVKRNIISDEEKELYDYGLFMIISYMTFFLISILFGIALNILFPSILFYISFCLVRNFAGGIHANSEIKCDIITTVSIIISEILIRLFIDYVFVKLAFLMLVIASVCLCLIKPVATTQKEISQQEKLHFHKIVVVLTVTFFIISIISIILGFHSIIISLSTSLTFANTLLIIGKLQQYVTH